MRMDFSSKMEQSITLYEHLVAKVILVYLPTILDRFFTTSVAATQVVKRGVAGWER